MDGVAHPPPGFTSLSQHIELIWLASLLLLLGGGQFLLYAMYDVILIDVTKETEEGRRYALSCVCRT